MQTQSKSRGRAVIAGLAVLSMFLAGATGAVGLALTTTTPSAPAAEAGPGTRGFVLGSARNGDNTAAYTLREANEAEIADVRDTVIGGRGASFAFQFFNGTLPVYNNLEDGNNNLAGYISCGSSCGRRSIIGTATATEGFAPCSDTARIVPNDVFQSAADCTLTQAESQTRWAIFGASDQPYTSSDYTRANAVLTGEVLHLPLAVGVVTLSYNLRPQCTAGLDVTPLEIARIFRPVSGQSGQPGITHWDSDAAMVARNPCLSAVGHVPIQPVIRCDGSGTTFAWSDFLARAPGVGAPWVAADLIGGIVENEHCGPQNAGVSQCITGVVNTATCLTANAAAAYGRVGYVELTQALVDTLDYADVRNRDDTAFVTPTPESGAEAANNADLPEAHEVWTTVTIVNSPGSNSYPAATFTYALVLANPWAAQRPAGEAGTPRLIDRNDGAGGEYTCAQYGAVRRMLDWLVDPNGGQANLPLGYAGIGQATTDLADRGIRRMACGPESGTSIVDVRTQGFPAAGTRVEQFAAGASCPAPLPLAMCNEVVVFQPIAGRTTQDVGALDVLLDIPALGIGGNLNGQWVRLQGSILTLPASPCAAGVNLPVCNVVLVDGIPAGYISGAMFPHVTVGATEAYGQVIDNLVVFHG